MAEDSLKPIVSALHADFASRVERTLGDRSFGGRDVLSAQPGIASELTIEACRSLGAEPQRAFAAAAALHAAFIAIALVDELLDEDPHDDLSVGRIANLASVAQSLALDFCSDIAAPCRELAARRIARMLVDTAWGQERDVMEPDDGETWSLAAAKAAPLFETALYCGALTGGASSQLATELERLGGFVGRIVQVQDDLTDVLAPGNDSDWRRPGSNLALRYALNVDHADRGRVRALLTTAGDEGPSRDEIRRILGTCGAIEYAISSVLFYADEGRRFLDVQPVDSRYLTDVLDGLTAPTRNVLASLGVSAGDVTRRLVRAFGSAAPA
jgi:geranylgeranyl pyrophosphate synthase